MLAFVMVLIFLLGFPFEWIEICLIVLPIFGPILLKYDFSEHLGDQRYMMAWFGTLVAVNLQTAFMTPPFGATLFYMKGTAPPGVTMSDVYRAMYPFVALQLVGLMLCIYFRASFCGCQGSPASSTSLTVPMEGAARHPRGIFATGGRVEIRTIVEFLSGGVAQSRLLALGHSRRRHREPVFYAHRPGADCRGAPAWLAVVFAAHIP
jgi:hypothetical protein